jgi:hypothetical protein
LSLRTVLDWTNTIQNWGGSLAGFAVAAVDMGALDTTMEWGTNQTDADHSHNRNRCNSIIIVIFVDVISAQ